MKSHRPTVVVSDLSDCTRMNPVGFIESLQAFIHGFIKFV